MLKGNKTAEAPVKRILRGADILDLEEDVGIIFQPGDLRQAVFQEVPTTDALTRQEEEWLAKSKAELEVLQQKYKAETLLYADMLKPYSDEKIHTEVSVALKNKKTGRVRTATPGEMRARCILLRNNAKKYINFSLGCASKLLSSGAFDRAGEELDILYKHAKSILSDNHDITLDIRLRLAQASLEKQEPVNVIAEFALIIEKLTKKMSNTDCPVDTKRTLATAHYMLAQYYAREDLLDKAEAHLEGSENIRQSYGAPEKELDRIRYLKGCIALKTENNEEAIRLLGFCYKFRRAENAFNPTLVPVLEALADIMKHKCKLHKQAIYLKELRDILLHHKCDARKIISVDFKLLNSLRADVSPDEYFDVLNSLEERLAAIPVNTESKQTAQNYINLGQARMSCGLPQTWSIIVQQEFVSKTLKLFYMADRHLNGLYNDAEISNSRQVIASKIKDCLFLKESLSDSNVGLHIDKPPHPDDKAEPAAQVLNDLESVGETSTEKGLRYLSTFSSDLQSVLSDPENNVLTAEDFANMPKEGHVNPFRLRFAQGGINPKFRDGKSLQDTKQSLIDDPEYTKNIPPIEIGVHEGKVYSFDTRRLLVHQQSKEKNPAVYVRYKKILGAYLAERVAAVFSPRAWNGFVTAQRYGGKNSSSEPYINPAARRQLEDKLEKGFVRHPNERAKRRADANGFCNDRAEAQVILSYLQGRLRQGSQGAASIIEEAKEVKDTAGVIAAQDFLIEKKNQAKQRK